MLFFPVAPRVDVSTVTANASVWVYTHAGDPAHDPFLRVWGSSGFASVKDGGSLDDLSFGYLRFPTQNLKLEGAKSLKLVLYELNPPPYDPLRIIGAPLEVRALTGSFDPETWQAADAANVQPSGKTTIFGTGYPSAAIDKTSPIKIEIDLTPRLKEITAYAKDEQARYPGFLYFSLTSIIDPADSSPDAMKAGVYKIYSASAEKVELRPQLVSE